MKFKKEPASWVTVKGNHIPIMKGQSKKDAVSLFFKEKSPEIKKDISLTSGAGSENDKPINAGAKSGALNMDNPKDYERAKAHAIKMYTTFRNIKSDIKNIAKNTGYTEEDIGKVKKHIFFGDFDEDFDQAQTWDRLRKGIAVNADYIFIKHELEEIDLMQKGMSYIQAHEEAQKKYNYAMAIKEYKEQHKK